MTAPLPDDLLQRAADLMAVHGSALLVAWRYATGFLKVPTASSSPEVQVLGGALADRAAMERLSESIDRVGDLLEELVAQKERHHAAEDLAIVHRRLDDVADLRRMIDDISRRLPSV